MYFVDILLDSGYLLSSVLTTASIILASLVEASFSHRFVIDFGMDDGGIPFAHQQIVNHVISL